MRNPTIGMFVGDAEIERRERYQKREHDGRYAFDGNLQRLCVCGHSLAVHSAGSPADCLLYSFPENDPQRQAEQAPVDCGCKRFRLSRTKKSPRKVKG